MDGRWHGLGDDDETIIVGKMTLSEIVARRARDYGLERAEDLVAAMGMSYQHARCMLDRAAAERGHQRAQSAGQGA